MTTTVITPSSGDTEILYYSPSTKHGSTSDMGVGFAAPNELARSLVKFDLSSIPINQIIDSVTLTLYTSSYYKSLPTIKVYRLLRDWVESQATWNVYASGASWQTAGASGANDIYSVEIASTSSLNGSAGQPNNITISATEFQKIYDGTYPNYGFLLKSTGEAIAAKIFFHTKEYSGTSYDPKLTIVSHTYDPTPYGTYDQYTKALLHFDGSEGSYTFRDEIQNTWTPYRYPSTSGSGPYISTGQQKFGTASGYFSGITGSEDWIETSTNFAIGSQDFTAECWIRPNLDVISGSPNRALFGIDNTEDTNSYFLFWIVGSAIDNQRLAYTERISGSYIVNKGGAYMPLQDNIWQHVAYVKQGNQINGYLDGTQYLSGSCSATITGFANQMFRIANTNSHSTSMYRGYMDEFRLSVGIARWTSDFTPPDRAYAPVTAPRGQPFMYSSYPWI